MKKGGKITLTVLSCLSFLCAAFWGSMYHVGGYRYLYHSQAVEKQLYLFFTIVILILVLLVALIALMFKSKKPIRIISTILLIFFTLFFFFSSVFATLFAEIIGPNGCSYTEDIANYRKYDNNFSPDYFPACITDDMTVVQFAYYYKYADCDQNDLYLEVKFETEETMNAYLERVKNAFSENGFISYPNPYDSKYTDIIEKEWIVSSASYGDFASVIEFYENDNYTKYVDMKYYSVSYSYDELTMIYNYTDIGSDILFGYNPDKGYYCPKYLERFNVEYDTTNDFHCKVTVSPSGNITAHSFS